MPIPGCLSSLTKLCTNIDLSSIAKHQRTILTHYFRHRSVSILVLIAWWHEAITWTIFTRNKMCSLTFIWEPFHNKCTSKMTTTSSRDQWIKKKFIQNSFVIHIPEFILLQSAVLHVGDVEDLFITSIWDWRTSYSLLEPFAAEKLQPINSLIPASISNRMSSKMWHEIITYTFPNFDGAPLSLEWISNSTLHVLMNVITYPCWD